jgi:hypothetical protein
MINIMYILCINLLANKYVVYLIFINLYLMFNSMVTGFVFNKTMLLFFFFQVKYWVDLNASPTHNLNLEQKQ